MRRRLPSPAMTIAPIALVSSTTGLANAARRAVISAIDGYRLSVKPHAGGGLLLGKNRKFPAAAIPTVSDASQLTATIDLNPSRGLTDEREMSSTLVTTEAGSAAAGSEGVSEGATRNLRLVQANPIPLAANPLPESLQYVTGYDNGNKGGFAGSESVANPENFRRAYNKASGAVSKSES
jgi:hypothetical protein